MTKDWRNAAAHDGGGDTSTPLSAVAMEDLEMRLARGVVNVQDQPYNAVGDGANDDTAEIQAAIDALPAGGGVVYFPPGTYKVTSALTRAINNVSLVGSGVSSVITYTPTTGNCMTVGGNDWRISSLKITGSVSATAGGLIFSSTPDRLRVSNVYLLNGWTGIDILGGVGCWVTDCNLDTQNERGIRFQDSSSHGVAQGNRVVSSGHDGILFGSGGDNCVASDNHVELACRTSSVGASAGIHVINSSRCRVVGNYVTTSTCQGILVDCGVADTARDNVVEGNVVYGNGTNAVDAAEGITLFGNGGTGCTRNIVKGNTVRDNVLNNIEVWEAHQNVISGNVCTSNRTDATGLRNGIYVHLANGNVVADNVCANHPANGIQLQDSDECVISSNLCVNNNKGTRAATTDRNGITLTGTCETAVVIGNRCSTTDGSASQKYGINTENTSGGLFIGNQVAGNATGGIAENANTVANRAHNQAEGVSSISSAATLTLPSGDKFVQVTGTTGITNINATFAGDFRTLQFTASLTVTDGGNLRLPANFAATADDTLTLICDGSNWFEVARSNN
jgi:parallel beta-helix repeat protein